MYDFIFQVAGLGISAALIALSVTVQRIPIIMLTMTVSLLSIVTYIMSGSWSACAVAAVTLIYGAIAIFDDRYPALKSKSVLLSVMATMFAAYFITTPTAVSMQLLVLVGTMSGILSMALENQVVVKIVQMAGNLSFMAFAYSISNFGQIPGQVICFVLLCVSLIYLLVIRSRGVQDVPEMMTVLREKMVQRKTVAPSAVTHNSQVTVPA